MRMNSDLFMDEHGLTIYNPDLSILAMTLRKTLIHRQFTFLEYYS